MNWYYVDNGQQAGPVDEAQLQGLVSSGKIKPETLVWHEGMNAWTAYRDVAPPAAPPPPGAPPLISPQPAAGAETGSVICSECGRAFSPSDVIRYGDKFVCANCKPVFFQRLREGAATAGAAGPGIVTEADLLARDYEVDIGGCLNSAWELFKAHAGILIGASVLVYIAIFAVNGIPYANAVLGLIFNGPLMGGLWLFYIKKVRNQDATVGDAFGGFGPRFWQLVLTQLIPGLITGAVILAIVLMALPAMFVAGRSSGSAPLSISLLVVLGTIGFVIAAYLNVCWMFALPLAADKGLKFWPALELSRRVVTKHWWMTFGLVVVSGVLGLVGFAACCVGVLVTGPVAFAMLNYHYQRVFGDLAPQS